VGSKGCVRAGPLLPKPAGKLSPRARSRPCLRGSATGLRNQHLSAGCRWSAWFELSSAEELSTLSFYLKRAEEYTGSPILSAPYGLGCMGGRARALRETTRGGLLRFRGWSVYQIPGISARPPRFFRVRVLSLSLPELDICCLRCGLSLRTIRLPKSSRNPPSIIC